MAEPQPVPAPEDMTLAVAAAIAAEREAECRRLAAVIRDLAAVISPARFRLLADWFDIDDQMKAGESGPRGTEVQDDLRRFADLLEAASSA